MSRSRASNKAGCLLLLAGPAAIFALGVWLNVRKLDGRRAGLEARGWACSDGPVKVRGTLDGVPFETRVWASDDHEDDRLLHEVAVPRGGGRAWMGTTAPPEPPGVMGVRGAQWASGQRVEGLAPAACSKSLRVYVPPGEPCPAALVAAYEAVRPGPRLHNLRSLQRDGAGTRVFFWWDPHADADWVAEEIEAAVRMARDADEGRARPAP